MVSIVDPSDGMSAVGMSMAMATQLAMLSSRLRGRTPFNEAGVTSMAAAPSAYNGQHKGSEPALPEYSSPAPEEPSGQHLNIDVEDWDILFAAVKARLRRTVGDGMEKQPDVPAHSSALSASLVQAVVLDCVIEMDKLHASLKQQRSQRPTP